MEGFHSMVESEVVYCLAGLQIDGDLVGKSVVAYIGLPPGDDPMELKTVQY